MAFARTAQGAAIAAGLALAFGQAAKADYVTVDLSSYVDTSFGNLIGATGGTPYPTGTTNGLTGIPFNIANVGTPDNNGYGLNYWGGFLGNPNDHGLTLQITGLSIANATTAYTLINSTFGDVGDTPTTIKFVSTIGSLTFDLVEGTTIRDYNDDGFNNTITSPTTEWFNNGGAETHTSERQRLDQQTYDLSSLGGTIIEVDVTVNPIVIGIDANGDPIFGGSAGGEDTIFSGLTFLTAQVTETPEPGTLALLGSGLIGLALRRRLKRR